MPLSNASRLADFGTGIGTAGAIIKVDNVNQRLGVGTTAPTATLGVAGIVSATAFYGDGSNLDGVASAGLGTALSEEEFNPLTVIYQTSDTLSVGATITVDPPDATTKVAYTQYADIKLEDDADLIIADGDDFIPDILGLSTEGFSFSNANGNGIFDTVYTDNIENAAGRGAPNFPLGITVSGISTLSGNVSIGGTLTYEDVTNVDSVGVITARSGIVATGVVTATSFKGDGSLLTGIDATSLKDSSDNIIAQATSTGIGIGTVTPANLLEIQGANGAGGLRLTETNHTNLNRHGRIFEYAGGLYFQSRNDTANGDFIFRGGLDSVEKFRIGSSSQIGIAGANYGTSGQVLTSGGASAAVQWASVSAVQVSDGWWNGSNLSNAYWSHQIWGQDHGSTPTQRTGFPSVAGQGMSLGGGEWTFPSAGLWKVEWNLQLQSGANNTNDFYVEESTNSGSSWSSSGDDISGWNTHFCGNYSGDRSVANLLATINFSNATTYRLRCKLSTNGNAVVRKGTMILFTKLN